MHEIHQNISACSGQWVRWVILSVACIKYIHTHTHTHTYTYTVYVIRKRMVFLERDECLPAVYRIKTKLLSMYKVSTFWPLPNTPTPPLISLTLYWVTEPQ